VEDRERALGDEEGAVGGPHRALRAPDHESPGRRLVSSAVNATPSIVVHEGGAVNGQFRMQQPSAPLPAPTDHLRLSA